MDDCRIHADLMEVAARLSIVDEAVYKVNEKAHPFSPRAARFVTGQPGQPAIVAQVGQLIYDRFYRNVGPGRGGYRYIEDRNLKRIFAGWLNAANTTVESWSSGWEVVNELGDKLILRKGKGRVRAVDRNQFKAGPDGKTGSVQIGNGSDTIQPGWYYIRGTNAHETKPGETVRLYFALSRAGAAPWVHVVTKSFNEAGIPFVGKTDSDPEGYKRADAAVLYLPKSHWTEAQAPLRRVYEAVWPYLRNRRPMFTKAIANGIGLAEEPLGGGSFGSNRSGLCASGLWEARNAATAEERHTAIRDAFQKAGVDPDRPWLAQAGPDIYTALGLSSAVEHAREVLA